MSSRLIDLVIAPASGRSDRFVSAVSLSGARIETNFGNFVDEAIELSRVLVRAGLTAGQCIGIAAPNCREWLLWDVAIQLAGGVVVALPESVRGDGLNSLRKDKGLGAIILDGASDPGEFQFSLADCSGETIAFDCTVNAEALAADSFTRTFSSGTAGYLKGLEISASGTLALIDEFVRDFAVDENDRFLIFLPLSNYQQRMLFYMCLLHGISVSVCRVEDVWFECRRFNPTFLIAPPSFYENLLRLDAARSGGTKPAMLGGAIRFLITGMAPISLTTLTEVNARIAPIFEVYGVVECGMVAWNSPGCQKPGTAGKVLPGVEVTISEEGEILVRKNAPLCCGYFDCRDGDAEATFLHGGLVATGDLGQFDEEGFLLLTGRKKELIMTKGGAKYHPEEIERRFDECEMVQDVTVFGDYDGGNVTAALLPAHGWGRDPIIDFVVRLNTQSSADRRIRHIVWVHEAPSVENSLLTRNLKKNRSAIAADCAGRPVHSLF